jgi:hypothetical protein
MTEALDREEWRSIPDVPNYEASSLGRLRRATTGKRAKAGKIVGTCMPGWYCMATLYGSKRITVAIHPLIAAAFIGPRPPGLHINHIDGNKHNNAVTNLEYVTPADNNRHAFRTGLNKNLPAAKLSVSDVIEIRRLKGQFSYVKLAAMFSVSETTIADTINGLRWKKVGLQGDPQ